MLFLESPTAALLAHLTIAILELMQTSLQDYSHEQNSLTFVDLDDSP